MPKPLSPELLQTVATLGDHHPETFVTVDIVVRKHSTDQWETLMEFAASLSGVRLRYDDGNDDPRPEAPTSAVMQAANGPGASAPVPVEAGKIVVRMEGLCHQVANLVFRIILMDEAGIL